MQERSHISLLRPPTNETEATYVAAKLQALQKNAAADQHNVLCPTHLVERGPEIIGYISLGSLPTMHVWMDSQRVHGVESLRLLETAEALAAERGHRQLCVPCAQNSPFSHHMQRLGFTSLGLTELWVKNL